MDPQTLQKLNKLISIEETRKIIHSLSLNKAPEADGLLSGYYKAFRDMLAP